MFTRAFTRHFFFRRGQHGDSAKRGKPASRSRSTSPDLRVVSNVLQPSSASVSAGDNRISGASQDSAKDLASKRSLQQLGPIDATHDENSPVDGLSAEGAANSSSGRDGSGSRVSAHDASTSFILVDRSQDFVLGAPPNEEEDTEDEMFETPKLENTDYDQEESLHGNDPPEGVSFTDPSTVTRIHKEMDSALQAIQSRGYPITPGEDIPFPDMQSSSLIMEPRSLHTGLLSDITEADESKLSEGQSQATPERSLTPQETQGADRAGLSFSSFGSSYAHDPSTDTSAILLRELASQSSTPIRLDEALQNIHAESVITQSCSFAGALEYSASPSLPPRVSLPSSSNVELPSATSTASSLTPPSETAAQPVLVEIGHAISDTPAQPRSPVDSVVTPNNELPERPAIPAPTTYADAMNLALQYPEMSAKLLKEPLASASSSSCPTPLRSRSPARRGIDSLPAKPSFTGGAYSGMSGATPDTKTAHASGHTTDRPNWALAAEEPRSIPQSRSRGRSIVATPIGSRSIPKPITHPLPPRPRSRPPTPENQLCRSKSRTRPPSQERRTTLDEPKPCVPSPPAKSSATTTPSERAVPDEGRSLQSSIEKPPVPAATPTVEAPGQIVEAPAPTIEAPTAALGDKGPVAQDISSTTEDKAPPVQAVVSAVKPQEEKAEPWLHRVSSWVEQTSSIEQASPNTHNTPMGSSGTSPTMPQTTAKATNGSHDVKTANAPRTTTTLNPHAPVWEFKPRQRAATSLQPQMTLLTTSSPINPAAAQPSQKPPPISPTIVPPSQSPPSIEIEANIERLRMMLRESGLEAKWSNGPPPRQQGQPAPSNPPQSGSAATWQHPLIAFIPPPNLIAAPNNTVRQRTNTHNPVSQGLVWQPTSNVLRFPVLPPGGHTVGPSGPAFQPLAVSGVGQAVPSVPRPTPPLPQMHSLVVPGLVPLNAALQGAIATAVVRPQVPVPPPAVIPTSGATQAVYPPISQVPEGFQFAYAGRHPGDPPPPTAPGPGNERSPSTGASAAAAADPVLRFYGIETPRVVFDKHGWTVS
ncbi:hypothetical protein C8Q77DRAFT_426935 [Trametes polyzona]|nr:hypothetical protein C8Q77DRAFT_426935 [Trametes polyzona]